MTSTSTRQPLRAPDDFWRVIERCLVEFHGWDVARASERVERFQSFIAPVRSNNEDDLILHAEPFELACDMAGKYLDLAEHRQRYEAIIVACRQQAGLSRLAT
jgi:hypothetical protein